MQVSDKGNCYLGCLYTNNTCLHLLPDISDLQGPSKKQSELSHDENSYQLLLGNLDHQQSQSELAHQRPQLLFQVHILNWLQFLFLEDQLCLLEFELLKGQQRVLPGPVRLHAHSLDVCSWNGFNLLSDYASLQKVENKVVELVYIS